MFGYDWLVLLNKRFHQYNRFYLLGAAVISWVIPFIKIDVAAPALTEPASFGQFAYILAVRIHTSIDNYCVFT